MSKEIKLLSNCIQDNEDQLTQNMKNTFELIDLTQPLCPESPTWNGSCGFCLDIKKDYDKMFRVQQIKMHAGIGTHMDAPSHRFEGAASIADLSLENMFVPAYVIDVVAKAHGDYTISIEDVRTFEREHGKIQPKSLVLGYTGWSRFWTDTAAYRNVDSKGQMHFPGFSKEAAELLLERDVVGIAIDTLSPDCLDQTYPVHKIFLGAGRYIIENVADLKKMPPKGAYAIAFPLKAVNATECPIRLVGLI